MPDVNLIKDTEGLGGAKKRPLTPQSPALSEPEIAPRGGLFQSLFSRFQKPVPAAPSSGSSMGLKRANSANEHIISEKRQAGPSVIPLPEDEGNYNVNLLSEELITTVTPRQRLMVLGAVAVGVMLLVGVVYGGLVLYQRNVSEKTTTVQNELTDVRSQVAGLVKVQKTAAETTQKLTAIRSLIDQHARWTKFFSLVEKYTLPSVTYGGTFTGTLYGDVTLSATTSSYEEVARQYLVFKQLVAAKKFISRFSITGATASKSKDAGTKVNFTVSLTLLADDFTLSQEEAKSTQTSSNSTVPSASTEPAASTNGAAATNLSTP